MNLLKIETDLLALFLDRVTQRWKDWKNSPDVAFYRDCNQFTSISFPDIYIDHNIPNGNLEIMKDVGEGEWKAWEVESREERSNIYPILREQ